MVEVIPYVTLRPQDVKSLVDLAISVHPSICWKHNGVRGGWFRGTKFDSSIYILKDQYDIENLQNQFINKWLSL